MLTPIKSEHRIVLTRAVQVALIYSKENATKEDLIQALTNLAVAVLSLDDDDPVWLAALKENQ